MVKELVEAKKVFLDNDQESLDTTRQEFEARGLDLDVTRNVKEAQERAISNDVDIFICDNRLEPISIQKGIEILKYVRERNKNVFLAIYSAYTKDFQTSDHNALTQNGIFTYSKVDTEGFLLNLSENFKAFQLQKKSSIGPTELEIAETAKATVINSLKLISNQSMKFPVRDYDRYSIERLVEEIKESSAIGRTFVNDWLIAMGKMKNV